MKVWVSCLLVAGLPMAWAQHGAGEGKQNPLAGKPGTLEAGAEAYANSCSGCHGPGGEGGRGPNLREGEVTRRLNDEQLFSSIQKGVPGTDMPPFPFADDKVWQLAAFVRSLSAPAFESAVPGNVDAGREVFLGKGGCAGCHAIRGSGGVLGPDLSNVGMGRSVGLLREAVIKPNARISQGFEGVRLTLNDGAQIRGVAKDRTNYAIVVLDKDGKLHHIDARSIKELEVRQTSLMPADYLQRLTKTEIEDVIAYLSRQSVRPAGARKAVTDRRGHP